MQRLSLADIGLTTRIDNLLRMLSDDEADADPTLDADPKKALNWLAQVRLKPPLLVSSNLCQ
jgi:hypothetical protein